MHKYTGQFLTADKECHRPSPHVESTAMCMYAYMYVHIYPAYYIYVCISGQSGSAAQAADWPRLVEARGSLEHDLALKGASGESKLADA